MLIWCVWSTFSLRDTIASAALAAGVPNPLVVIAAIANSYGGYVTTTEEYSTCCCTCAASWVLSVP